MARDWTRTELSDLARQTEEIFKLNGAAVPEGGRILKLQKDMVEQAETFARHWLERRRDAGETGLTLLNEIRSTNGTDPVAAMKAITAWQNESFKRLNADLQEWVDLCTKATQLAPLALDEAVPQDTDRKKPSRARSRTASSKANHATPV